MTRGSIRFLRRGQIVELRDVSPMRTLLDYLRLEEGSRGTKEGCGEGDCGACTVALGSLRDGRLVYEPVNACILLMGQVDGKEIVTVDDLAIDGKLHPVQHAMVDAHASQCGFCTPGFVMSLFTLYQKATTPDRQTVLDHIAGNLCRCTGYRPIVDAAFAACNGEPDDAWSRNSSRTATMLRQLDDGVDVFIGDQSRFLASPASVDSLLNFYHRHPDATLVAGATDVGLWITKQLRQLDKIIVLHRVAELDAIVDSADALTIGATATYAEAQEVLGRLDPDIGELLRRLGSTQVRCSGTVGGNIANGSPIGDTPPVLIALGASLQLRSQSGTRVLPLEDFFIVYGKQDRRPGEIVANIVVPKLKPDEHFRCFKISKRFDQDISAVMGAFKLIIQDGRITGARIAYGGLAGTPKRAPAAEAALQSVKLRDEASWRPALDALSRDYQPIADHRASADYRNETARALLQKALLEISGAAATRLIGQRGRAA